MYKMNQLIKTQSKGKQETRFWILFPDYHTFITFQHTNIAPRKQHVHQKNYVCESASHTSYRTQLLI